MPHPTTYTKRIFFGVLLIATFVLLIVGEGWLSLRDYGFLSPAWRGIGFVALVGLFWARAAFELDRLIRAQGMRTWLAGQIAVILVVAAVPIWAQIGHWSEAGALALVLWGALAATGLLQASQLGTRQTIANLAVMGLSLIYLGVGGYFVIKIRLATAASDQLIGQIGPLGLFLLSVKATDVGGYLVGSKIGKRKLCPSISPGKSWEGLLGGVLLSMIVASLFAELFDIITVFQAVAFALVVSLAGQMGDLLESMIKRDAEAKDSAKLVPEFGGVLDMIDSILGAAPVAYIMLTCWD